MATLHYGPSADPIHWIEQLMNSANSSGGIALVEEMLDTPDAEGKTPPAEPPAR